jgi:ferredoxin-NADP reductase
MAIPRLFLLLLKAKMPMPTHGTDAPTRHRVQILDKHAISHDVNRWTLEKPDGYTFKPGQASHIALDKDGYRDEDRPFTFTSLPDDPTLELIIKTYPSHDGVTDELADFEPGQHLLIEPAAGAIEFKGPGIFIAGGAGVTPFVAIFRQLFRDHQISGNRLIFANQTADDVFLQTELQQLLGDDILHVLSDEDAPFAVRGKVNSAFLQTHCSGFDSQFFYLCGPPPMGQELKQDLLKLGADKNKIVHEDWS